MTRINTTKGIVLFLALAALLGAMAGGDAWAAAAARPRGLGEGVRALSRVELERMPRAVDRERLLAEDVERDRRGLPRRFAVPFRVHYTPESDGTWEETPSGTLVWRLRVRSAGAANLNLGFTRYRMPAGGALFVYPPDGAVVRGPFTAADNEAHGELWTPVIPGDEAVIEVEIPPDERSSLELELTAVNHGYRELAPSSPVVPYRASCQIDVACRDADEWRRELRSVALFSAAGLFQCTGALLNNVRQDGRPFFLTAWHCEEAWRQPQSVVMY